MLKVRKARARGAQKSPADALAITKAVKDEVQLKGMCSPSLPFTGALTVWLFLQTFGVESEHCGMESCVNHTQPEL